MECDPSYVVMRFDPENQNIAVMYSEDGLSDDLVSFGIIDIPVSDLKAKSKEEAMSIIGSIVLTTFERMRNGGIGLSGCVDGSGMDAIDHAYRIIEERANQGDAESQNALGSKYLSDSIEKLDVCLLERAEEWYKKAAANGYERARRHLEEAWPSIKEAYRQRIEKKKEEKGN